MSLLTKPLLSFISSTYNRAASIYHIRFNMESFEFGSFSQLLAGVADEYPSFTQILDEPVMNEMNFIGEVIVPGTPEEQNIKIHEDIQLAPEDSIVPESPILVAVEESLEKPPKIPQFTLKRKRASTPSNGKRVCTLPSTCTDSEAMKLRNAYPVSTPEDTVLGTINSVVASDNTPRFKHPIFTIPGKEHSVFVDSPLRFLIFDLAHMADDHIRELRRIAEECELPMHLKYNFEYEDKTPFDYEEAPVLQCVLINKMYNIIKTARKTYTGKVENDEFWFENLILKLSHIKINFCGNGTGVTLPLLAFGAEKVYILTALVRNDIIIGVAFVQLPKTDLRIYGRLNKHAYAPITMDGIYYPPHWKLMGIIGIAKKGPNVRFEDLASVETTIKTRKHKCMGQYAPCDSTYIVNSTGIFTLFTNTLLKNKVAHIDCN